MGISLADIVGSGHTKLRTLNFIIKGLEIKLLHHVTENPSLASKSTLADVHEN